MGLLQHIPCLLRAFDSSDDALQHQLMSLNRLCVVFVFCTQMHGHLLPSKLAAFISSCLYMASITTN